MAITVQQPGGTPQVGAVYRLTNFVYLQGQMAMDSVSLVLSSVSGGAPSDSLGSIVALIYATYNAAMKATIATAATAVGAKLAQLFPSPKPLPGICVENAACSGGANPSQQQVSGLLTANTAVAGRAYRGRYYVPFPWVAAIDSDLTPTAAYKALLATFGNALFSNFVVTPTGTTYTFKPVIFHRRAGKTGVPAANTYDLMVSGVAQKEWATQRRRGDYGRLNPNAIH